MSADSTATVTFVVTALERICGAGRLVALASVEIDLEGVVVLVQGVQVIRHRGHITTQAPRFRNPKTGTWMPAVVLPQELGVAIAEELHQMLQRKEGHISLPDLIATPIEALLDESMAQD